MAVERWVCANSAAPSLLNLLVFPKKIWADKIHQITHIPAAQKNSKGKAAELSPCNDMCKRVLSNFGNSMISHVAFAKPSSKKFHFVSHRRPVQKQGVGIC